MRGKPFEKGWKGGPGRPRLDTMVVFDLRQAARKWCPKSIEVIAKALDSKDERVRLMAAEIMLSRGYGKAPAQIDVEVQHAFAVVPEVLDKQTWLETRGQGHGSKVRPPDAMHPGNILDLKVADDEKPN